MIEVKRDRFLRKGFKVEVNIAILFLRFFVGFMMLTHAVDKIENFGVIAEGFPTLFGLNSWVALSLITFVEFVGSIMIIAGLKQQGQRVCPRTSLPCNNYFNGGTN